MAVVFSMGLVGALFPLMNFTGLIMGHLATPYYFSSAQNRWSEFLHPHLPRWLFPTDENGAMRLFFEGLPPGHAIPWEVWVVAPFLVVRICRRDYVDVFVHCGHLAAAVVRA